MNALPRRYTFVSVVALSLVYASITFAQEAIPLTIQPGVALHVALEKQVRVKNAGVAVEGRIVEPVFVFDRMVIPAGSQIFGRVANVEAVSRTRRALSHCQRRLHAASAGACGFRYAGAERWDPAFPAHYGFPRHPKRRSPYRWWEGQEEGTPEPSRGSSGTESQGRGAPGDRTGKSSGKWERLKAEIASQMPYHRQWLTVGTQFTVELKAPLEFGNAEPAPKALAQAGAVIPPGSVVRVSLITPLSSATDRVGSPVQAIVSEPLFSSDHHLILAAGTRLNGSVTALAPARRLHRNGQLRFMFRQIELSPGAPQQKVEASLQGIDADAGAHMKLDAEGGAHAVTPKTNIILPAIDVMLAAGSLDGLDPHRRLHPNFHQGPDIAGGTVRGGAGFGLIGSVIGLAAHYRPISSVFAFYGAGWSVYTHFLARGDDVVFLKNTPMEIRFGTHESPPLPDGNKMIATGKTTTAGAF